MSNVEVHKLNLKITNKTRNEHIQNEDENNLVVDISVDWLYQKLYVLALEEKKGGQKEYRIATCDIGKQIILNHIRVDSFFIFSFPGELIVIVILKNYYFYTEY